MTDWYTPTMPTGEYLQYGGQAIIEGVMMRSPRYFAVACRAPNGEIVLEAEALEKTWIGRQKWLKFVFIRGSLALLDAMALGIKAMKFASKIQLDDQYQPLEEVSPDAAGTDGSTTVKEVVVQPNKKVQDATIGVTMIISILFGLFLFDYLPNVIAEQLRHAHVQNGIVINFATEVTKILFLFGYLMLISKLPEIQEVFMYHGAEHKAINTLEADQALTLENCQKQTRLHPRCGTSFMVVVLIVSMIMLTFVPRYPVTGHQGNWLADVTVRFLIELLILPVIAGVSYELIRLAGKFRTTAIVNTLFWPGLMSQYLTTREPTEKQIEVALTALKSCMDAEVHGFPGPVDEIEPAFAV